MSSFFKPKGSGTKSSADEDVPSTKNEDDDKDHSSGSMPSGKKIKGAARRGNRGSILHRNSERPDHLRRLFLKRKIAERFLKSLRHEAEEDEEMKLSVPEEEEFHPSVYDESFLRELRDEVEEEMDKEIESAKIRELEDTMKEYKPLRKDIKEYPLEVRLGDVTYTVPVDESSAKIQTVYNSSFLYPLWKFAKRRLWRCEPKPEKVVSSKKVLANISLVLKPGRQYLVLGAPGSGKTTLLRTILGLVKPKNDEELEGVVSYNGRTLDVSIDVGLVVR